MQFWYAHMMVHSFRVSNSGQRPCHLLPLQYTEKQADVYMETNRPAPSHMLKMTFLCLLTEKKKKKGLIMHKHNNFL